MFLLVFLLLAFTPHIFGCGGTISAQTGQIMSPDYPDDYYMNADCIWDITVSGSSIILYFESSFGVEEANGCKYDYVQVDSLTKYCGSESPGTITISSDQTTVTFHSDNIIGDIGFSANFSAVVNGEWSDWSDYIDSGECSSTCGTGSKSQTRTRQCDNPAPFGGGSECSGSTSEDQTVACNLGECPVDGGWSEWSDWEEQGDCSVTCGDGMVAETRNRTCDSPEPMYGGSSCEGIAQEGRSVECTEAACEGVCEVDGTKTADARDFTQYYECQDNELVLQSCAYQYSWDQDEQECVKTCTLFSVSSMADPTDCYKYIQCVWGFYISMSCPSGTAYSADLGVCDYVSNVQFQY